MSAKDKELAAEHAVRAVTQAQHAASNVADAIGYEKDAVGDAIAQKAKGLALELQITNTPLAIVTVLAITGTTALAVRGGRDVLNDLRVKRADRLEKKAAESEIEARKVVRPSS